MELTDDELKALERWRAGTYIKDEGRVLGQQTCMYDARKLADAMLRRYPVRTYCNLVIRWEDTITPERLVACGWAEDFRQKTGKYHLSVELHLDTPEGRICFSYTQSQDHGKPYTWITFHHYDAEDSLPDYTKPRNMLEVWNLMERCGIKESGE